MRSGRLRDRVVLQRMTEASDPVGQMIQTWSTVGTYWANVQDLQGKEAIAARQYRADLTHVVETRGLPVVVTPAHRFLDGSRVLNVQSSVDVDGTKSHYMHYCISVPEV